MTIGADGIGRKSAVKGRNRGVAGEAKLSRALMGQHMPVDRAMRLVAGCATFNPDRTMLIDEWPLLVSMAFEAGFILKPAKPCPWRLLMSLVAVSALNDSFLNSVPLIERNLFCNLAMAGQTELVAFLCQQLILSHLRMRLVTFRAGHRAFHVVASVEEQVFIFFAVAIQALLSFLRSRNRSLEAEDCFHSSACFHMGASLTVAGLAALKLKVLFLGEVMDGHFVVFVLLLMAFLAGLRADVVSQVCCLSGSKRRNNQKTSQG